MPGKYTVQTSDSSNENDTEGEQSASKGPTDSPLTRQVLTKSMTTPVSSKMPLSNFKKDCPSNSVRKHGPIISKRFTATGNTNKSLPGTSTTPTTNLRGQLLVNKAQSLPSKNTTPTAGPRRQQYSNSTRSTTTTREQLHSGHPSTTPTSSTRSQLPISSKSITCGNKVPAARKLLPSASASQALNKTAYTSLPSDETPMSENESDEDESCNVHGKEIFQELRSTNLLLGKLINEMRQTECRLEEKATATTSASSSSSGASERKTKCVPLQIRVRIYLLMVNLFIKMLEVHYIGIV